MTSTPHPGPHHHPRTSTLRLATVLDDGVPSLRPLVDGRDLLSRGRSPRGPDPDRLLPPLSSRLLPTVAGRDVVLGTCSCGVEGCGALEVRVRRVGGRVLWEPSQAGRPAGGPAETLDRAVAFGLLPYLDAVDAAAAERVVAVGQAAVLREGSGRRVAREVRLRLGLVDGHARGADVRWVAAWPWSSTTVHLCLPRADGTEEVLAVEPRAGEGEAETADRICRLVHAVIEDGSPPSDAALNG